MPRSGRNQSEKPKNFFSETQTFTKYVEKNPRKIYA